ncbi:MAG: FAD-dependent oxidoreductase [Betaproteobacteria bacterium]|nr:FAD-dependent oxidoreductase [Betaproteobacteria bacterium]
MHQAYRYESFPFVAPPELSSGEVADHPLIVIGCGPVGLAAAIDARQHGIPVLLLDDDDTVSVGSRGLCYAKRTLEILDRLGCGDSVVAKGVGWDVGRTFFREEEVFNFNLRPQTGSKRPGMVNLQQYYLEEYMVKRALDVGVQIRWKHEVTAVSPHDDHVALTVSTPEGSYQIKADWLIVADGARSPVRAMLGLDVEGKVFMDRFLIADVIMKADFPAERWFWFDPPFHPNQSVLLHREADDVYRIDFQLGWDANPEEEKKPERVIPRIKAMLGDEREFSLEWVSVYTFQCRRLRDFRHGRCLFAGDAAHQVSPFGARGANSGIQDADNLIWKLKLVMDGRAPLRLLDSYTDERGFGADENILNSTRSTDFITPKGPVSQTFRNAVLALSRSLPFARKLVNSGRLSVPSFLTDSVLNTPDSEPFTGDMVPGAPMDDAPLLKDGQLVWLIDQMIGQFQLLYFCEDASAVSVGMQRQLLGLHETSIPITTLVIAQRGSTPGLNVLLDHEGLAFSRYDATDGTCYVIRPDQHVAARWRETEVSRIVAAVARATANFVEE